MSRGIITGRRIITGNRRRGRSPTLPSRSPIWSVGSPSCEAQEHPILWRVESVPAADVGDSRRGYFTGCRNQH
jgi:hypothetical protein